MLQPPALEKFFKFPLHIARQFLSLLCHKRSECRVILVNDLIEKGLLGSVALVTTSIPIPAGRFAYCLAPGGNSFGLFSA